MNTQNDPSSPVEPSLAASPSQPQQANQPITTPVTENPQVIQKPIWKSDAFAVLTLLIFWPIGVFLMWKYATWRKWVKVVVTFFFFLGALPILLIWGLVFGISAYNAVDNSLNPRTVNESILYDCKPTNTIWSKCENTKYHFSFEYPTTWNYIDLKPEGIGFSPSNKNLLDNFVISFGSPAQWDTESEAKDFADGSFSSREKTTISGLYATKDYTTLSDGDLLLSAVIVDGKTTYQFNSFASRIQNTGVTVSNTELKTIFDHMVNSFTLQK